MMKHQHSLSIANAVGFQVVWFLCVLGNDLIALAAAVLLCLCHQIWIMKHSREWWLVIGFSLIGIMADSILQMLGIIQFNGEINISSSITLIPIWMMCLWCTFSTTLTHGLFWLHGRFLLASLVGLIIVPASYYAGLSISGSAAIDPVWMTLLSVGLLWSVLLPLGLYLVQRWKLTNE